MALTFQRRLKLALFLSNVAAHVQRLHLLRPAKERHLRRNVLLAGSAVAVGAAVVGAVCSRRDRARDASAGAGGGAAGNAAEEQTPAAAPDRTEPPTDSETPPEIAALERQ